MCRLLALTADDISPPMKRVIFNQLQLAGVADRGQVDGAGVGDGIVIRKSGHSWLHYGNSWLQNLQTNAVWLGHVRRASQNTEISSRSAHPFRFFHQNMYFDAAHNGTIYGTGESDELTEPNVDSYRAFKRLNTLLREQDQYELNQDVINAWIKGFGRNSRWTCMITFRRDPTLHILRGTEPMHYMTINDGVIFDTSETVLLNVKEWLQTYWPTLYTIGRITAIAEYTWTSIPYSSHTFSTVALDKPITMAAEDPNKYIEIDGTKTKLIKI